MAVAGNASKKKYAYLDQLSTEDLKAILRASALSEEADDPALIDYALEVIMQRENEKCTIPDVGQAQKEFDQFYRELENPLYPTVDEDIAKPCEPHLSKAKTKKRSIRRILIAAAIIATVLSLTCIPVFGYANVVQMVIAYWTDDYFTFREKPQDFEETIQNETFIVPEGFEDLWDIAEQNRIQGLLIPQYIPDGFQVADTSLNEFLLTGGFTFRILYLRDDAYISIDIIKDSKGPRTIYEKDIREPVLYQLNGTEYRIFTNNGESTSALYVDDIEYSYGTNLPANDLKEIIDSMI